MSTQSGPTSHSFLSQRLRLNYVDWGNAEAPLLILQHGGRDHARSWDWVADELRHDWHVICPDLRGHGDSDWSPEGHYGMDAFVYDFAQLVHILGNEQVTIVGHSLGGGIATRFAGLYPDKVARFVNIEGLGPPPEIRRQTEQPVGDRLRQWIEARRRISEQKPRRYPSEQDACLRMRKQNPSLTEKQARHLNEHGLRRNEDGTFSWKFDPCLKVWSPSDIGADEIAELWRAITCPVLLLWGMDSWATSPRSDGRLDYFREARLIEYDHAGHWLHHNQFDRFIGDVKSFLAPQT